MNGKDYIATVRLTDKPGNVLAYEGGTCEHVPEASWPWLLEQGLMVPAPKSEPKRRPKSEGV